MTILCSICGRRVEVTHSAEWNSETCIRCLPPNDNPELARLERMKAATDAMLKARAK